MSEKSFEETLKSLESAAERISGPATSLEEAIRLFEQGMKDADQLEEILKRAEQKIAVYRKDAE